MPHSNFKERSRAFNTGVGKCSCGQTFKCASEREIAMKHRMHCRFCSNPPVAFDKIRINITIPGRNQEATLYLQELTSTLPIRNLIQVRL